MASFIDPKNGAQTELPVHVGMYKEAADRGMSFQQYINTTYPTVSPEKNGSTFQQLMASEGIYVRGNRDIGIRPSTMADILQGRPEVQGGTVVKNAVPTSRILFPAVIMSAVEDKLLANLEMTANAFDAMVGIEESINQERYEQPVMNFNKPESARAMGIGQLAEPASMMTITTLDKAYRIPSWAIGIEVSDQALRATTIDFVALSLARQAAVERNERAQNYVLALLNGDIDNAEGSLASLGFTVNATALDAASTGGNLTQRAWMRFLMRNGTRRSISHLVTDIDTALKIEGRANKPTIVQDDGTTNRFDTQFTVLNPTWARNPALFLTDIGAWPANTIMALDKNFAIRRVRNLSAQYQAVEAYVMRRSTAMRFDFGEHVNRMYPEAFDTLVLA